MPRNTRLNLLSEVLLLGEGPLESGPLESVLEVAGLVVSEMSEGEADAN